MSSVKDQFAKINSASASSHPLASLNLTGEFLGEDYVYRTATTFGSLAGSRKWVGGVLAPNGKIYGIPFNSTTVLEIDPVTKTATTFGSLDSGPSKWRGGVLAPNGKIYGIPLNSTTVLEIDTGCLYNCDWALSPLINKFQEVI